MRSAGPRAYILMDNRMSMKSFVERQSMHIRKGGRAELQRKMKLALHALLDPPSRVVAIPAVAVLRLMRPWLLVRIGKLKSKSIGHFTGNTELYLCERDAGINVPKSRYADVFFMEARVSNQQLATMWKRVLHVWSEWILAPVFYMNARFPGGAVHTIGDNTQSDRDVHNLLDRFPPHARFTPEEERRGEEGLRKMGIPPGAPFVCLIVRDSSYLMDAHMPGAHWSEHNYRDTDIQNYVLAAETLANLGYVVLRMGAKVHKAMPCSHPRVIDYATNGMRSDFMDIYLGAKCAFCISTSTGFDGIPCIFRRPIVYVNVVPLGYFFTFRKQCLGIFKRYVAARENRELALQEIFACGLSFALGTSRYESKGVRLIENTPEEIRDVAVEMEERLRGVWRPHGDDDILQKRFWEIFPSDMKRISSGVFSKERGAPMHGEIRARIGAAFLRNNRWWLSGAEHI